MGLVVVFNFSGDGVWQDWSSTAGSGQFVDQLALLKAFPAVAQYAACLKYLLHAATAFCMSCEPSLNGC